MNRERAIKVITSYIVNGKKSDDFKEALLFALADMEILQEILITVSSICKD